MAMRTAGLAVLAALVGGCHAFDESLLRRDAGRDGGAIDAGVDAAGDAGPSCRPRLPPARPGGDDVDGAERVYLLRDAVLVQGEDWRSTGFDLDGKCTARGA